MDMDELWDTGGPQDLAGAAGSPHARGMDAPVQGQGWLEILRVSELLGLFLDRG